MELHRVLIHVQTWVDSGSVIYHALYLHINKSMAEGENV